MKLVMQRLNDETTIAIAEASEYSGIESLVWNATDRSIFDMFHEKRPDLLLVHATFFKNHYDEIKLAATKYGGKVFAVGMEIDEGNIFGRCFNPFANLIQPQPRFDKRYRVGISMIVNYLRPNDHEYIQEIISTVDQLNVGSFRIYGSVRINSPYYVGPVHRTEHNYIYNNTDVFIDLYGDHFMNPILFNNYSVCELYPFPELDGIDGSLLGYLANRVTTNDEPVEDHEKLREFKIYKEHLFNKYNNFDELINVLNVCGLTDEISQVKQAKENIINERWSDSR